MWIQIEKLILQNMSSNYVCGRCIFKIKNWRLYQMEKKGSVRSSKGLGSTLIRQLDAAEYVSYSIRRSVPNVALLTCRYTFMFILRVQPQLGRLNP